MSCDTGQEALKLQDGRCAAEEPGDHEREWLEGLMYCHSRMNANTNKILEIGSFAYALIEILSEKGLITIAELDARKATVFERLKKKFTERGMGVAVLNDERDKYQLDVEKSVDCASRIPVCKAACCRLAVALTKQDIEEGRVRWDLGQPYMMVRNAQGYCSQLEPENHFCRVREYRPLACRAYDCRKDERIWADFENRVLNPDLEDQFTGARSRPEMARRKTRTTRTGCEGNARSTT